MTESGKMYVYVYQITDWGGMSFPLWLKEFDFDVNDAMQTKNGQWITYLKSTVIPYLISKKHIQKYNIKQLRFDVRTHGRGTIRAFPKIKRDYMPGDIKKYGKVI